MRIDSLTFNQVEDGGLGGGKQESRKCGQHLKAGIDKQQISP
jgi:hypothetical protein